MIFILTSYSSKVSVIDICEIFPEKKIKYFKNSRMIKKKFPYVLFSYHRSFIQKYQGKL